jgi:hypothetical protein
VKPSTLKQLIAQIESNNNPLAIRYEPAHNPKTYYINRMATIANCSLPTAAVLCSCSFGAYQIMGDGLIDLGLEVSPLAYVNAPAMQDLFFNEFITRNNINYSLDDLRANPAHISAFARRYNGDVVAYSAKINALL